MRISPKAIGILALLCLILLACNSVHAQVQPPSEQLLITTDHAVTWNEGETVVVLADAPVTIETDRSTLRAQRAVLWISPARGGVLEQQNVEIALLDEAQLDQPQAQLSRRGDRLFVTASVRGSIRIVAENREARDLSDTDTYREAIRMRPLAGAATQGSTLLPRPWIEQPPPNTPAPPRDAPPPFVREPINFRARHVGTTETAEGKVAFGLSGGVTIYQRRANGDLIELQADNAVLFTPLNNLRELSTSKQFSSAEDAIEAAYLEGDVRINFTPAGRGKPEQNLQAERVFYEFGTDRAILTHAVIHTLEPEKQIPITIRAQTVRQLSVGEYRADKVELSTSQFRTPSYSIKADRAYVRQVETGDPRFGTQTQFVANSASFHLFGVPYFWWPMISGSMTDRGSALRNILIGSSNRFGFGVRSEWGLFESLGMLPPEDLDISYQLDYLQKRGPAGGVNVDYKGGYITETTKEPWDFAGEIKSYIVNDHGEDRLGSQRRVVTPPDNIRGRVLWEHQHFFPGDWQVQVRAGYSSDPTFLEEYFERDYDAGLPHNFSAYVKRQKDTEALTLTFEYPTNDFVTTSNELQEQAQLERYPEVGYHRIGDSFAGDSLTFFSDNRAGFVGLKESGATLAEQGFRPGQSPGIPSYATTGADDSTNFRGDFRQELNLPFSAGQFKIVPYVMGRYTGYTDAPDNRSKDRLFLGAGVRVNTAMWKTDDSVKSELFDIHRLRHVIEPELNLFTSAQTRDQTDFFIYDEPVDAINDVTAIQLALHQRWQTKRGGAGRFRSVDFLSLNIEGNFFFNQPADSVLNPTGFRGLFYPSIPEASLARNSINTDALWRISDSTALLADAQYNIDQGELATTSIGLAVQRDPRLSYFIGTRYIGQINSTIANIAATYDLSAKYTLSFNQGFNLSDRTNQNSSVTIIRRFDRLLATLTLYYDAVEDQSGFQFGLIPEGLGVGISSDQLNQVLGPQ
ncbi:MAG: LPS assembly protein LptD [Anaerolineae bacterium]|nr:LPS assembly protein LptD [Phycisphaerae bacterium]